MLKQGAETRKPILFLVDDDESTLKALQRLFRDDFSVHLFSKASVALTQLSTVDPDIILTDYMMPEMSGFEFLKHAKHIRPSTVRIILSGQTEVSELSSAISHGLVHRFFLKPWENNILHLQMMEALSQRKTLAEKDYLVTLALTDPITELGNYRFFQEQFHIEIERARRHQRYMSLMMIDVDHFKSWNDQLGHPSGDILLKQVAHHLLKGVRNIDWVCRYGGDEFAIILPDTKIENTFEIAERLRKSFSPNLSRDQLDSSTPLPQVSLSFGLASFPTHANEEAVLLEKADQALYEAKRQGRNQTKIAEAP